MQLILFGPPAAGKSTQAELISKVYDIPHVATGDLLRQDVREGTPIGREAKKYMDRGLLVPDDLVVRLVREHLKRRDAMNGFVLDGFPRTVSQAAALNGLMKALGREISAVIDIEVSDEEVLRRISGRRICPTCDKIYNVYYNPPQVPDICDDDGSKLYQRDDDREAVVERRIEVYDVQTKPLIAYYRRRDLLIDISGDKAIDAVHAEIMCFLKSMPESFTAPF